MSYPPGCTQADHDKAFNELGEVSDKDRDFDPYEDLDFLYEELKEIKNQEGYKENE